jgi:hypothetical protein
VAHHHVKPLGNWATARLAGDPARRTDPPGMADTVCADLASPRNWCSQDLLAQATASLGTLGRDRA